jgi:hypothetical protein
MPNRICLTGKVKINGRQITRDEWMARIKAAGHTYTENADQCDILVASRLDTVKAGNAQARGVKVRTYDWLSNFLDDALIDEIQAPVAVAAPIDTAELEENPLWGSF